jgi:hypothetical protein
MRGHKMYDFPPHGRKDHRAAEPGQKGAGEGNGRTGCAPDQGLTDDLDRERADRHRQAADTIGKVAEKNADQNEAAAERGQAKSRMAPVPVEEVENEEHPMAAKPMPCRQTIDPCHQILPITLQNEGRSASGCAATPIMGQIASNPKQGRTALIAIAPAKPNWSSNARPIGPPTAKAAVDRGADQGEHPGRAVRTDETNNPGDDADPNQALTEPKKQPAGEENKEGHQ